LADPSKSIRRTALEEFQALPWPTQREEEWRRSDPSRFKLSSLPSFGADALQVETSALPEEAARQGVILSTLSEAAKHHPELVEKYLFASGKPKRLVKFALLHQALAHEGLFCFVPKGASVALPLGSSMVCTGKGAPAFPHVIVALEQGASLTLIDERRPAVSGNGAAALPNEMAEIFLAPQASLTYVRLQHWPEQVREIFNQRALLEQDARLLNVTVGMGSAISKGNVETVLQGPGAHAELLGIFFGHRTQHFDYHTLQDHRVPNTTTNLFYKTALKDHSKAVYTGLIRIDKEAQKTDAFQTNRNLLLSQGAKADALPMLEILADDVHCSHAAATGPVDEDHLFYLMSRGLPRREAQRLVVEGFFNQVIDRIPVERVRQQLIQEATERLQEEEE